MKKRFSIVTTLIIFLLFGTILAGCDPEYSSLSLSLNVEQIQMSVTDEKADYYITIENHYDFNAKFSFSFAKSIAWVDEENVEYKGNGVYKFTVYPITADITTLTIDLNGLNKPIEIPVIITKELSSITAHESLYVVRGSSLKLNNSMFDFTPGETNLKGLKFEFPAEYIDEYKAENITLTEDFVLSAPENCPYDSIWVTAISTYDANISTTFEILAINNINTTNFNLKVASQNVSDPNAFDDYSLNLKTILLNEGKNDEQLVLSLDGKTPYYLDLILSDESGHQKKLAVEYDLWHKKYETIVSAGQNLLLDGKAGDIVPKKQNFDFVLSATDVQESDTTGSRKVTFKVYQANLTRNHVYVNLYVNVIYKPKYIAINGQVNTNPTENIVELYTNSSEIKTFGFSVVPDKANVDNYNYNLSFYKGSDIQNGILKDNNKLSDIPNDYISVKYGGAPIEFEENKDYVELDAGQTEGKLSSRLTLQAIASTKDDYIAIKIDCLDGEIVIASAVMYIKVYVGTKNFEINKDTIYLSLTGGTKTFSDFTLDEGATVGELTISTLNIGNAICDIVQKNTASCDLEITPKQVGRQEFVITTANNKSVVLNVVVIREITDTDFYIVLDESQSDAVANSQSNQNNMLTAVTIKGIGSSIKLIGKIANYTDTDSNSYSYKLGLTPGVGDPYFSVEENSIVTSKDFTKALPVPVALNVELTIYYVENFEHKYYTVNHVISLECVNFIKELSIYASEDAAGETKEKTVSIYNKGDLSYVNQNLSTIYLYMDLKQSSDEEFTNYDFSNFTVYFNGLTTGGVTPDLTTGEVKRNNSSEVVGVLNLHKNEGFDATGYLGNFTYDYSGIVTITSIQIIFTVTDVYTNTTFTSAVVLNVEKYIDVDSLWLSTPQSVIYLDETASYQKTSISVQVLPSNAMCTELDVWVDTNFAGCVRVDNNQETNTLTFTYQSAGNGTIYIFPKSKMKTQSYYDEFGNMYYHLALDFVCADGQTEQTALKLSNYEDLKKIVPNKHYFVDTSIDCKGNIVDIPVFNATLRGTFEPEVDSKGIPNEEFNEQQQIGSINNFKVSTNGYANIGLFRQLGETAKIYNISFTGMFDNLELSEPINNIGLVCGTNNGTIKNVTASLKEECVTTVSNISPNNITVYFGMLAGYNKSTISVVSLNKSCKSYTLLANNTTKTPLNIDFVKNQDLPNILSYFGGVVGINEGTISQQVDKDFVTIGLYGISTAVYANTNASYMAGVAGKNSGNIIGLKATGTIKGKSGVVAGFVGELSGGKLENNISRVFVSGESTVAGFVGKIVGTVESSSNNIVQATDDGTKISAEASLIVGIGEYSNIFAVAGDDAAIHGVKCESYFTREYPDEIKHLIEEGKDISDKNIILDPKLSKAYYYGDMLMLRGDADTTLYLVNKFEKGDLKEFNKDYINQFVLPAFKQALYTDQQANVNNKIETLSLLKFARVGSDGERFNVNDIQIELSNPNLASVENYGTQIDLKGVGHLQIKVVSTLNYIIEVTFDVYVTNYYESVKIYNSKDKIEDVGTNIILLNTQTTNIYFDCYSSNYNYNNTPITLVSNNEVTFDVYYDDLEDEKLVSTEIHGAVGYLKTTGGATTFENKNINFISKYKYKNVDYYRYSSLDTYTDLDNKVQNKNVVMYSDGLYTFAFVSENDFDMFKSSQEDELNKYDSKFESITKQLNSQKGIDSLKLNKYLIEAEPTDSIEIVVTYVSYNNDYDDVNNVYINNDIITPSLKVYDSEKNNDYQHYQLSADGKTFKNTFGGIEKTLFELTSSLPEMIDTIVDEKTGEVLAVKYTQTYSFKMPVDTDFDLDTYEYLKNKKIELVFEPEIAKNQTTSVLIQYKPENITSVLINNYNKNNNLNMIETKNGITTVYAENIIYTSAQTSINEMNVLNAYVYTNLSEFDYVDVTMSVGTDGGYLAFLEYESVNNKKVGYVSTNSIYTTITGGVTLRIYKKYIQAEDNTLLISLIYKIPKTVADGTYVPIVFNFYKNGQVVFPTQINLLGKIENQVSFEIYDKEPINANDDVLTYQVARGKKYLLDTTIIGYTPEQAVFESSSPNVAYITKEGGDYYLNITSNAINYDGEEYFTVTINSYGQKLEYNQLTTGIIETTELRIYEYLVDIDDLFEQDTKIGIRMKQTVDIREVIADKISFEYSKVMANSLNRFKNSFIDNATFVFVNEHGEEIDLTYSQENMNALGVWKEFSSTNAYKIKCYKDLTTGELHYTFIPLTIGQPCDYSFKVYYNIEYVEGEPQVCEINKDTLFENINDQIFEVNVYVASSEQNATPIHTYADMLAMNDGEYYRLVNDITIKATEFQMITAKPAMFDGNGHVIKILSGAIAVNTDNDSSFALFQSVEQGSVFKNITVQIDGNLAMTLNNSLSVNGANIAILVAENKGIITNCEIKSTNVVSADIISTVSVMEKSYFAGLCAINSGYITHCQVECNLTANGASLAGVVAENNGDIASTYIKNSRIYNTSSTTNENIISGGFVCKNMGTINMCYVEGSQNSSRIYSDHVTNDYTLNSKIIYTATKVAGFVFENSGKIYDSYSNIPIVSTNMCSGFVGTEKGGEIKRAFSLCKLKPNDTLNYGFVISYETQASKFEDCFFIIENNMINYNTSETNYITENNGNIVYKEKISGIKPIGIEDFNIVDTKGVVKQNNVFKNFITSDIKEQGIWFYAFDLQKESSPALQLAQKSTYSCEVDSITNAQGRAQTFTARRLQLVSPNLLAYSKYDLELAGDGEFAEHTYLLASDSAAVGSKTNPYVITSATDFENYCSQLNQNNYEYFRLVCDIDFLKEEIYTTKLFDKTLVGYFEGNGFDVNSYAVNSITSNLSAGMFAQIGKQNQSFSCLKNINFAPTYINLPNSIYVGGVAGSLVNANVYNVNIVGKDVVIVGRNIVGGVFGRSYGETSLNNVYSDITSKASKYNTVVLKASEDINNVIQAISYIENGSNKTDVSYAGSIIGFAGGVAEITNINIGENARTQAMISGLLFGGVGSITTVQDFSLQLNSHVNQVVAYAFGGLIAGENRGRIVNFELNSDILGVNTFVCQPVTPLAIGGVAGLSNGGRLENMSSQQGYSVIGAEIINTNNNVLNPYNQYVVKYVGGVVGYSKGAFIKNVNIGVFDENKQLDNDYKNNGLILMGGNYVGGLVGYIESSLINDKNEAVDENSEENNIYLFNTTIINNKINLISSKTYIDQNKQEVTHSTYFSYVNTAVGDSYQKVDNIQKFGLIYGGATQHSSGNMGKLLKSGNIINDAQEEENYEKSNIVKIGQKLDIFHGEYENYNIDTNTTNTLNNGGNSNLYEVLGQSTNHIWSILVGDKGTYFNYFYNQFGVDVSMEKIMNNDDGIHENLYIKTVDLKTGCYDYSLWKNWYAMNKLEITN